MMNIPRLRFEEFRDEWEETKIGNVAKIFDGTHQTPKYRRYGVPFVSAENIMNLKTKKYISQEDYDNEYKNSKPQKNDLLMTRIGLIGLTNIVKSDDPLAYYVTLALIKPCSRLNSLFLLSLISSTRFKIELWRKTLHIAFPPKINKNEIPKINLYMPSIDEQQKIGSFFADLDNQIKLQSDKLESLKLDKKGYLQKMFPSADSNRPKLRLKGFKDEWETNTLGQLGETFTGLSGKTKEDFGHGNGQYITYMNVHDNPVAKTDINENIEIDTKQHEVKNGDVLFTTSSETPEEVGLSSVWLGNEKNVYLNSFCFGYRLNKKLDPYYLAYALRSNYFRKQMKILAQGISRYNISKINAMNIKVPYPSYDEQKMIGIFLSNLDKQIELQNNKLVHLKLLKKAYLQKMFI